MCNWIELGAILGYAILDSNILEKFEHMVLSFPGGKYLYNLRNILHKHIHMYIGWLLYFQICKFVDEVFDYGTPLFSVHMYERLA